MLTKTLISAHARSLTTFHCHFAYPQTLSRFLPLCIPPSLSFSPSLSLSLPLSLPISLSLSVSLSLSRSLSLSLSISLFLSVSLSLSLLYTHITQQTRRFKSGGYRADGRPRSFCQNSLWRPRLSIDTDGDMNRCTCVCLYMKESSDKISCGVLDYTNKALLTMVCVSAFVRT